MIALYSIRSERQLCEQLQYNLLFQWFLDLDLHAAAFDASTFAKNKERLLRAEVARLFFEGVSGRRRPPGSCRPSTSPSMGRSSKPASSLGDASI